MRSVLSFVREHEYKKYIVKKLENENSFQSTISVLNNNKSYRSAGVVPDPGKFDFEQ